MTSFQRTSACCSVDFPSLQAAGPFKAAEEVCAGDAIDAYDVLEPLTQLVNKSLVMVIEKPQTNLKPLSSHGDLRYRMLETIRQYGHEKLFEANESEKICARHFDYYLKMAKHLLPEFFGPKRAGLDGLAR